MAKELVEAQANGDTGPTAPPNRRARRRQETIEEILDIAQQVMTEDGVNGLSLAEVARRLGVQPPSIYKYYPSLMAIYDELFRRGQAENLEVMRRAIDAAEPGMAAITAGLEASGRWLLAHRALAQLLFWRPVPKFEPSPEAFAPAVEMVAIQRAQLANAVARGEVGPAADSDEAPLSHLDPDYRSPVPGDGQRARPGVGRGPVHSAVPQPHGAVRRLLSPACRLRDTVCAVRNPVPAARAAKGSALE